MPLEVLYGKLDKVVLVWTALVVASGVPAVLVIEIGFAILRAWRLRGATSARSRRRSSRSTTRARRPAWRRRCR